METTLALALGGLGVVIALNLVANRLGIPAAVLLVAAGSAYAWLPGPNLELRPHFVLAVVISPLLYATAVKSSAIGLRANGRIVVSLSVGLVIATALVVGFTLHSAVPGLPVAAAVALGAAVAPSDPVAALAIGRRVGLPERLVTIIEGEGLLNDATALTLFQVAVATQVSGSLSILHAVWLFFLALVGGAGVGLAVAIVLAGLRRRISDPLADNAISLATPFLAFLPAEALHGSGVLAVVVAGLWFAHRGPSVQGGEARLQSRAVWTFIEYLLEGFAFVLIGQQLPSVLHALHRFPTRAVALAGIATVGGVLVTRLVWLAVSEGLPARFHTRLAADKGDRHRHLEVRDLTVLWWSGTRGVITLAAAFSLPLILDSGQPFPDRDLLLFCGYLVVVCTLIGQGSTYAPVVRRLSYPHRASSDAVARNEARIAAVHAALSRLEQLSKEAAGLHDDAVAALREAAARRLQRYEQRVSLLSAPDEDGPLDGYRMAVALRRGMIDAERTELLRWRDTGRLSDRNLRVLLRELDHEEGLLPNG